MDSSPRSKSRLDLLAAHLLIFNIDFLNSVNTSKNSLGPLDDSLLNLLLSQLSVSLESLLGLDDSFLPFLDVGFGAGNHDTVVENSAIRILFTLNKSSSVLVNSFGECVSKDSSFDSLNQNGLSLR